MPTTFEETAAIATEEEEFVTCATCGSVIKKSEAIERDGTYYCEECCLPCEDCDEMIPVDDIIELNRRLSVRYYTHRCVCPDCRDHGNYFVCDDCEEDITEDGIALSDDDHTICYRCRDNWVECYECHRVLPRNDAEWNEDNDEYYCSDCFADYTPPRGDVFHSYGYKPYDRRPNFHDMEDETDVKLHFGIEQETDKGNCRSDYCEELYDLGQDDQFIMKYDGSLDNGVEIVSYPCSFRYFMEKYPLDEIHEIAKKYHYKAHDAGTCGLHIHVSRVGLGENQTEQDLNIAKMMLMYDKFWDNIVIFSRRSSGQLDWACKPDADIKKEDTNARAIEKAKRNQWDHRRAVNLQHDNTVEFRIFRGSLNPSTVKASIQFCKVMVDYVMSHNLAECQDAVWADLVKSDYAELNEYLVERGLATA